MDFVVRGLQEDVNKARQKQKYARLVDFVRAAWPIVEGNNEYRHNWHIDAICEHLEAVSNGKIKNLLINIPPGCMKSLITAVFWPAWEWTRNPAMRFLSAAYEGGLSTRDAVKTRTLIESDWYQKLWGDK